MRGRWYLSGTLPENYPGYTGTRLGYYTLLSNPSHWTSKMEMSEGFFVGHRSKILLDLDTATAFTLQHCKWNMRTTSIIWQFEISRTSIAKKKQIAWSHDRFPPNGGLVREIPLFQENPSWWNIMPFGQNSQRLKHQTLSSHWKKLFFFPTPGIHFQRLHWTWPSSLENHQGTLPERSHIPYQSALLSRWFSFFPGGICDRFLEGTVFCFVLSWWCHSKKSPTGTHWKD